MEVSTVTPTKDQAPAADERMAAARKLQAAMFKDMLRHGGFAEAFSTGSGPLDSMTGIVLDRVAEDLCRKDPGLAEHFYRQMNKGAGEQ